MNRTKGYKQYPSLKPQATNHSSSSVNTRQGCDFPNFFLFSQTSPQQSPRFFVIISLIAPLSLSLSHIDSFMLFFYLLLSTLLSKPSTRLRNPFTISRICLTLSNSISSSSICRKISRNRAISTSAAAMAAPQRVDCAVVEICVCAVNYPQCKAASVLKRRFREQLLESDDQDVQYIYIYICTQVRLSTERD